eukprot:gene5739-6031_t
MGWGCFRFTTALRVDGDTTQEAAQGQQDQHTTEALKRQAGLEDGHGLGCCRFNPSPLMVKHTEALKAQVGHGLGCFRSTTALLVTDTHTERSRQQIIRPATWAMIQQRVAALPSTVRHVVIVATVPVIYPKIKIMESAIEFMTGKGRTRQAVNAFMQKTGLADSLYNAFGEVEIQKLLSLAYSLCKAFGEVKIQPFRQKAGLAGSLYDAFRQVAVQDDLLDHWSADIHSEEKLYMVRMLQEMSALRGFRITFLSGDVHKIYITDVISSAIGNTPPPSDVVKALQFAAKPTMLDAATIYVYRLHDRPNVQVISSAIWNTPPPSEVVKALQFAAKPTMLDAATINVYRLHDRPNVQVISSAIRNTPPPSEVALQIAAKPRMLDTETIYVYRLHDQPNVQVISSAIGNTPPPSEVVKALQFAAKPRMLDADTRECMMNLFGVKRCLKDSRNWCLVSESRILPGAPGQDGSLLFQVRQQELVLGVGESDIAGSSGSGWIPLIPGEILFQLRFEKKKELKGQRPDVYELTAPVLDIPLGQYQGNRLATVSMAAPERPHLWGAAALEGGGAASGGGIYPPGSPYPPGGPPGGAQGFGLYGDTAGPSGGQLGGSYGQPGMGGLQPGMGGEQPGLYPQGSQGGAYPNPQGSFSNQGSLNNQGSFYQSLNPQQQQQLGGPLQPGGAGPGSFTNPNQQQFGGPLQPGGSGPGSFTNPNQQQFGIPLQPGGSSPGSFTNPTPSMQHQRGVEISPTQLLQQQAAMHLQQALQQQGKLHGNSPFASSPFQQQLGPQSILGSPNASMQQPGGGFNPNMQQLGGGFSPNMQQPGSGFNPNMQQPGSGFNPNMQQPGGGFSPNMQQPGGGFSPNMQQPGGGFNPNMQQPGGGFNPNMQQPGGGFNPNMQQPGGGFNPNMQQPGNGFNNPQPGLYGPPSPQQPV